MDLKMNLPEKPGRARSRFSKALPLEPPPLPTKMERSPAPTSAASLQTSLHSPLPPLPKEAVSTMSIPRRPVGTGPTTHAKLPSADSVSSVYSDSPGFSRSLSNSSRNTKDSLSGIDSETAITPQTPPSIPLQDVQRNQRQQTCQSPSNVLASPAARGFQSSPTRPEIWRRRSLKSDKAVALFELKLDKSNGSTASPPRAPAERPIPLPRSRKPVPARPAPPQPSSMGTKLSKLKDGVKVTDNSNGYKAPDQSPHPSQNRLPTPEYLKTDKQHPLTPQVVSPASPETPPYESPPEVPFKSLSRRGPLGTEPLANTTNRPNFLSTQLSHSRELSGSLTITSDPVVRSPQPQKAFAARLLTPQPSLTTPEASPLDLPSPVRPVAIFPTLPSRAPEGTVFPALEIDIVHFECYQTHKFMRNSWNMICPVACMVCQRKDTEKRWRCTWCCLSTCASCMGILASIPGRDLKVCLERIGKQT